MMAAAVVHFTCAIYLLYYYHRGGHTVRELLMGQVSIYIFSFDKPLCVCVSRNFFVFHLLLATIQNILMKKKNVMSVFYFDEIFRLYMSCFLINYNYNILIYRYDDTYWIYKSCAVENEKRKKLTIKYN